MIDLSSVVWIVVYLIIAGAVFGLLYWLTYFIESQFPGPITSNFCKVARVVIVVLAVFALIGILISLISGTPLFKMGGESPHLRG